MSKSMPSLSATLSKPYTDLIADLQRHIDKKRIITDLTLMFAYGTDASFYRLVPKVVLQLQSVQEVILTLKACQQRNIALTFRAAGTSLSGQALSDSVLITLTHQHWRGHKILNNGEQISLQPGMIGAQANKLLAPYQRKIGPDPASINTCKIGGIAANNSSGMCCGTAQNSYNTLVGMTVVLADGTLLNTLDETSVSAFKVSHHTLLASLSQLAQTCRANTQLADKIRHKYRLKNTTGYSLNALIDYQDPIDILQHLFIGSEGTLGFIADVTYHTVIDHQYKATALYLFSDIEQTCLAVSALKHTEVAAVELMDNRSLSSVASKPGMPDFIAQLEKDKDSESGALLIEIHASSQALLDKQIAQIETLLATFTPTEQIDFSSDAAIYAQLWAIRKELFPAVGAVRESGTTVIIEDVAFPAAQLAPAVRDLQTLFKKYNYHEAIIFGHALDGNLHFVFTQAFETQAEIQRYSDFMNEVTKLVAIDYQGSLKAEHGTGRNMAPFIELEWGKDGFELMQQIKSIFDKHTILNPGVIINADENCHLSDLKTMSCADELVDKCIECGFCEPVCPSQSLSLTPRQRISVYREISRLKKTNEDPDRLSAMQTSFQYLGIDSCAATGLCATCCPVDINTGDLVRKLRGQHSTQAKPMANLIAHWTSEHLGVVTKATRLALSAANTAHDLLGSNNLSRLSAITHKLSLGKIPQWTTQFPRSAGKLTILAIKNASDIKSDKRSNRKVVYFPSCVTRSMGTAKGALDNRPLTEVTQSLLLKAGYDIILPTQLDDKCCGMPFKSKGFDKTAQQKAQQLEAALWQASEQGKYPILMDTSPCATTSIEAMNTSLNIFEPFRFVAEHVMPHITITAQAEPIMLHITCSSRQQGLAGVMESVSRACSTNVIIPEDIFCCGFAGDKGFTLPELNASALQTLKQQIPDNCSEGYSNSRTCEIGLSQHGNIEYRSILYLLDKVSSAKAHAVSEEVLV
ncbi:FAD-binding and (Fe-S)-binding domain-containing protein [Psychromonas sp. Urea-02u-13]|uniref:FAD-binding and (Fe-S)-binding domain-containing protein n=1 Tax=Psychromonas sp. Urea-02u-13 TaxID=2058326 RepID=UPI001E518316|nr:FAD-binding and (Fe-S)-binding domain-containing protein [Psychromonas sp. Urea-02u-13]